MLNNPICPEPRVGMKCACVGNVLPVIKTNKIRDKMKYKNNHYSCRLRLIERIIELRERIIELYFFEKLSMTFYTLQYRTDRSKNLAYAM